MAKNRKHIMKLILPLIVIFEAQVISCKNNSLQKTIFLQKALDDVTIVCDSINVLSEINAFYAFFHVENRSNNNILITINGGGEAMDARKAFLFISTDNDTLPFYTGDGISYYRIIKKQSKLYFAQLINRHYFMSNKSIKYKEKSLFDDLNRIIKKGNMVYVPDSSAKHRTDLTNTFDTLYILNNKINIDTQGLVVNPSPPPLHSLDNFIEEKIDVSK